MVLFFPVPGLRDGGHVSVSSGECNEVVQRSTA